MCHTGSFNQLSTSKGIFGHSSLGKPGGGERRGRLLLELQERNNCLKKTKPRKFARCVTVKRHSTFISKRILLNGFLNEPWHLCWQIWRLTWSSKQIISSISRSQPSSSSLVAAPKESRFTTTAKQRASLEINVSIASIAVMPSTSSSSKKKCAPAS